MTPIVPVVVVTSVSEHNRAWLHIKQDSSRHVAFPQILQSYLSFKVAQSLQMYSPQIVFVSTFGQHGSHLVHWQPFGD